MKKAILQEEEQQINVETKKPNFVVIYETLYKQNLTILESGLLFKLLTRAPTFKTTKLKLCKVLKCSKEQIEKATKGLKDKGILTIENNFKSGSKWTINQEPINSKIKTINKENLVNALLDNVINTYQLKLLWKNNYIDYPMYQKVLIEYSKELIRIAKIDIYGDLR